MPSTELLPALIAYRAVYYLLPLSVAAVGLVADELHQRRSQAARLGAALGWLTEQLTPRVLAAFTFLAGVVLLASGATPAAPGRLSFLNRRPSARRDRAVSFRWQRARRGAVAAVAGTRAPARCRVRPHRPGHGRRHRGVAPQGCGLRRGDRPRRNPPRALAGTTGVRSPGRAVRHTVFAGLDHGRRRSGGCVALARIVRVQARRVLAAISGGSSSCTAKRRACCARPSAQGSRCCSSASHV